MTRFGDGGNNGVFGISGSGNGVFGHSNSGYGMVTDGPKQQARYQDGWVKAMAFVDWSKGQPIARCFNSQLPGSNASIPPCGLTFANEGTGSYFVDFGFEIDDRFISVQPAFGSGTPFFSPDIQQVGANGVPIAFEALTQTSFVVADTPFLIFVF